MGTGTTLTGRSGAKTATYAAAPRLRISIALACAAIAVAGIVAVNPPSLLGFAWFFLLWSGFVLLCHREELGRFCLAFLVNSAFVALFVAVQSAAYPDSYGMTSPFSASWTDDSYFFTLIADQFPADVLSRPSYWEYSSLFSTLIRIVTPFRVEHPLDALFFQSGTAALLATFTSRYMLQLSHDRGVAKVVYTLCVLCPFLMMNGGVVLLRDTLVAALFIYSLCCIGERRFLLAAVAVVLQTGIRPGTGLLLLPAYLIIYFSEVRAFVSKHPVVTMVFATMFIGGVVLSIPVLAGALGAYHGVYAINLLGREVFSDLRADPDMNVLFLRIQEFPFLVRLVLNAAYIFLYPFLSFRFLSGAAHVDVRGITLNLVVPVYLFWLNAWFVAGVMSFKALMERHRPIVMAIAATLALLGIYSLQTRHKTIIYPLYYLVVAVGFTKATPFARRCGYLASSAFFCLELALLSRNA